jgi:hypothetical protein
MIAHWLHAFVTDRDLLITAFKGYDMELLYDDLAVQVIRNTGIRADGRDEL